MLRTSYIRKFKSKTQSIIQEMDFKALLEDDNFLIKSNRPIKENEIMNIASEDLEKFVDSVLTDKKLNNIIFSSNARSETNLVKKTSKSLNSKLMKKQHKTEDKSPQAIVFQRAKNEAIIKIAKETQNYKEQQKDKMDYLLDKNHSFYKDIQSDKLRNERNGQDYTLNYRRKRFLEIFNSIKEKVKENGVTLPEIELNTKNVYSRLFHNVVHSDKNVTKNTKIKSRPESLAHGVIKKITRYNEAPSFNVQSVLHETHGKEFTLKITNKEYAKCFTHHSGGPQGKINFKDNLNNKEDNMLGMRDIDGNTFLHVSVIENITELVYYFLRKGLDPNLRNNDGNTALHLSMKTENKDTINILLDFGVQVDILNNKRETAVDLAHHDIKKIFALESLLNEINSKKNR